MGTATRAVSRYSDWFVAAKSDAETTSDSDRIERLPLHVQKQSKYEQAFPGPNGADRHAVADSRLGNLAGGCPTHVFFRKAFVS